MTLDSDLIGNLLGEKMQQISDQDETAAASLKENSDSIKSVQQAMLQKFLKPKGADTPSLESLPDEVQEIIAVLQAQPALVPYTQKVLQAAVKRINDAVAQILADPA